MEEHWKIHGKPLSEALVEAKEVQNLKTKIVYVDEKNRIVKK